MEQKSSMIFDWVLITALFFPALVFLPVGMSGILGTSAYSATIQNAILFGYIASMFGITWKNMWKYDEKYVKLLRREEKPSKDR